MTHINVHFDANKELVYNAFYSKRDSQCMSVTVKQFGVDEITFYGNTDDQYGDYIYLCKMLDGMKNALMEEFAKNNKVENESDQSD